MNMANESSSLQITTPFEFFQGPFGKAMWRVNQSRSNWRLFRTAVGVVYCPGACARFSRPLGFIEMFFANFHLVFLSRLPIVSYMKLLRINY